MRHFALAVALLATSFAVKAQNATLADVSNHDLCVGLYVYLLADAQEHQGVTRADLISELQSREEACQPMEEYLAKAESLRPKRKEKSAAIGEAINAFNQGMEGARERRELKDTVKQAIWEDRLLNGD